MLHLNRLERVVILNLHKNKYKKTTLYPAHIPPPPSAQQAASKLYRYTLCGPRLTRLFYCSTGLYRKYNTDHTRTHTQPPGQTNLTGSVQHESPNYKNQLGIRCLCVLLHSLCSTADIYPSHSVYTAGALLGLILLAGGRLLPAMLSSSLAEDSSSLSES